MEQSSKVPKRGMGKLVNFYKIPSKFSQITHSYFQNLLDYSKYNFQKILAQQSCARKAGFLYLLKQQFSFSVKHKY